MVIVLGIIALILGAAITFSGGITGAARDQAAMAKIRELVAKVETYRMMAGRYPSEQQGLKSLVERPTSEPQPKKWKKQSNSVPIDPWGNEYVYKYPGTIDRATFEIRSAGEDQEMGTEDDLSSQEAE